MYTAIFKDSDSLLTALQNGLKNEIADNPTLIFFRKRKPRHDYTAIDAVTTKALEESSDAAEFISRYKAGGVCGGIKAMFQLDMDGTIKALIHYEQDNDPEYQVMLISILEKLDGEWEEYPMPVPLFFQKAIRESGGKLSEANMAD